MKNSCYYIIDNTIFKQNNKAGSHKVIYEFIIIVLYFRARN